MLANSLEWNLTRNVETFVYFLVNPCNMSYLPVNFLCLKSAISQITRNKHTNQQKQSLFCDYYGGLLSFALSKKEFSQGVLILNRVGLNMIWSMMGCNCLVNIELLVTWRQIDNIYWIKEIESVISHRY